MGAFEYPVVPSAVHVPPSSLPAPSTPRRKWSAARWSADEDEQLKHLVAEHGTNNWAAVAARLKDRSSRRCRERWCTHLRPQLNKSKWTPEEDQEIRNRVEEIGPKWTQISKRYMPNRSDRDIRTRWTSISRKQKHRMQNKQWSGNEDEQLKHLVDEHGPKGWEAIAAHMRAR